MRNAKELFQFPEKLILKLPALIMMDSGVVTKAWDKLVVDFFSSYVGRLIPRWVRLGVSREVVDYHKYVLIPSRTTFQM